MIMTDSVKITEVHVKELHSVLSSKEIERILVQNIADANKWNLNDPSITYKIRFEDETAGSPSYKVGVKAIIEISKDMMYVATAMPEPRK